ncbi:hypothetical protein HWC63_gp142 [Erwinia phage pEp_SNUABM_01]|uniref:Uncharacterized protein n=1 Tax=Erwinia phage pEp_SNUABM_01 TaxID=2601643 RepID=A0A5J6DBR6_9CAUD|nr:hypothetical protein HWC63_gp142 [Erwinia phage pEp_SNUABM_01]QEQ95036.1 hypothetical protein pEpSNUABM01_210 [Erwinia phage pEp_SNUABM_01]
MDAVLMMYTFYESFEFGSNSSTMRTKTWLTNKVDVYTDPQPSLVRLMQKRYGTKYASVNKNTNKLYVRQRVRRATVKYYNQERFRNPEFGYAWVENSALDINLVKEYNDNDDLSWRSGKVHLATS